MLNINLTSQSRLNSILLYTSCYIASAAYGFIYILSLLVRQWDGDSLQVGIFLSIAGLATLLLVGFSGSLAKKYSPSAVCSLGMVSCCVGFTILDCVDKLGPLFYLVGIFLGAGWSLYYATSPMIINKSVKDQERGKHLSLMAAFVVLGTATGPILSTIALAHGFNIKTLYLIPIALSFLAALLFYLQATAGEKVSQANKIVDEKKRSQFLAVITSEAKYPLIMVFLGACILSAMLNFQILYAESHHLNYSLYYLSYMAAVVLSRFIFGGILTKKNPLSATPVLLLLMITGLFIMMKNTNNPFWYIVSAIALGISYGLVYPLIKTYAVNVTPPALRHDVLAYFTLFYFLGVYGFPLLGSVIIKNYGYSSFLSFLIGLVAIDFLIGLARSKKYSSLQVNYESH